MLKAMISFVAVVGLVLVLAGSVQAAGQTWDGAASANWNTTDLDWDVGSAWTNSNDAVFGATGVGTVTINEAGITANSLDFNVDGYTIAGDATNNLQLGGGNGIRVGTGFTATVSAPIDGAVGLEKLGDGTLVLSGVNTYTGTTTVTGGLLQFSAPALAPSTDSIVINGGDMSIDDDVELTNGVIQFSSSNSINKTGTTGVIRSVTNAPITVTVDPTFTGTIAANVDLYGDNVTSWNALVMGGGGDLILDGDVMDVNRITSEKDHEAKVYWDGGGKLTINGTMDIRDHTAKYHNSDFFIGNSSTGSTVDVGGRLIGSALFMGNSGFGGNTLNVTGPGTKTTPTVHLQNGDINFIVGGNSSNNSVVVSPGAYLYFNKGDGTNTVTFGKDAGANSNTLTIDGTGAGMYAYVYMRLGAAGDDNTATVSNGGYLESNRIGVGDTTGSNNAVLVTGAGSRFQLYVNHNSELVLGGGSGASGNSFTIQDGASAEFGGTRDSRTVAIGNGAGANNNVLTVTGIDSLLSIPHAAPLRIGRDATATGNHLDVYSGATASLKSVLLAGVNSAFNLGDGTGISEAMVGQSSVAQAPIPGVVLVNSDSRLNFNSGRLIASLDGALVSGAGQVQLDGAAYFDTAGFTNSIDSMIAGGGDLTKEGLGTLTLTGANVYTGDTTISAGTLEVTSPFFDDASKVYISGVLDLNTGVATDTIMSLYLGGAPMSPGIYNSVSNPSYFSGAGSLRVVPEVIDVEVPVSTIVERNLDISQVFGNVTVHEGGRLTVLGTLTDVHVTNLTLGANSMVRSTVARAPANNVTITVDGTLRVDGGNAWVGDFFGPDPGSGSGGDQSFTNLTLTETARYEWSFTKSDAVDELWSDDGLYVVGTVNLADGLEIQLVDGGGSSAGIAGGVDVALFIPLNGAVFDPSKITVEAPDGLGWTWDTLIDGEGREYPDLQFFENTLVLKGLVTGVVAPHAGDANDDKTVDGDDLVLFDQQFGGTPGTTGVDNCDFDGDGDVDIDDFSILRDEWGWQLSGAPDAGPGASPSATPEPATMSLLAISGLVVLRRRRRRA